MSEQDNQDLYYYYHNWKAGKDNVVHNGSCKFCYHCMGRVNLNTIKGEHGVWVGPFATKELTLMWASRYSQSLYQSKHMIVV